MFFERRGKFFGKFMRRKVGVNVLLEGLSKGGGGVRVSRPQQGRSEFEVSPVLIVQAWKERVWEIKQSQVAIGSP